MRNEKDIWIIDLEASTAKHRDGWMFKFTPIKACPGGFDGECIRQPKPLTPIHLKNAARIAREAGEAFLKYRKKNRH